MPLEREVQPFAEINCYTPFHNSLIDEVMPSIAPNAWKVLCFILRQTQGWGQNDAGLSYAQLREGTGISSNETLSVALKGLLEFEQNGTLKPLILAAKSSDTNQPTRYSINRNAAITWTPERYDTHYGNRNTPVTEIVTPLYENRNTPFTKIVTPIRKEKILSQESAPSSSLIGILVTTYKRIAITHSDQMNLKQQAVLLEGQKVTPAELENWLASRNSLPGLNFICRDFLTWRENQRPKPAPTVHSSTRPMRKFCGHCKEGWILPDRSKGEQYARKCGCNRQEAAA